MNEIIGKIIDSGINDDGYWFTLRLNHTGLELLEEKRCPICFKLMTLFDLHNGRKRIYCSLPCVFISYRTRQASVDSIAVYRLINGDIPEVTTRAERMQAADKLTNRGYSLFQIADILHTTPRTISRYRQRIINERKKKS